MPKLQQIDPDDYPGHPWDDIDLDDEVCDENDPGPDAQPISIPPDAVYVRTLCERAGRVNVVGDWDRSTVKAADGSRAAYAAACFGDLPLSYCLVQRGSITEMLDLTCALLIAVSPEFTVEHGGWREWGARIDLDGVNSMVSVQDRFGNGNEARVRPVHEVLAAIVAWHGLLYLPPHTGGERATDCKAVIYALWDGEGAELPARAILSARGKVRGFLETNGLTIPAGAPAWLSSETLGDDALPAADPDLAIETAL